ncbi:MAG: hypothetical protein D8M57_09995 [Candidatus Scalindua sp. AMX11]|nr:MAG: hypothetical protein DWQ00_08745 [Candidatus Scalindua sp.]TDE65076.1 MAG: hypothetical protein D8M57_09995 [Candidatus Scalindua sp. AMX11]GJQ59469.1 MAG: hypothetical protein SCALA701_22700 [Candidatus Scalindua sp.]
MAIITKLLTVLLLATLLFGCTTTVYNITSTNELNGNKLLTGRLLFFVNEIPFEDGIGFTIFIKESTDKELRELKPDENGYIYVSVEKGTYHIKRITYRDLHGHFRFPIHEGPGIDVSASDTVVNFGTIKVSLQQHITSRISYVTTYGYPYTGTYIPSALKPTLRLAQIPDRDVTHQYILKDFGILPESMREEDLNFPDETYTAL